MDMETQKMVVGAYHDLTTQASPIGSIVLFAGHAAPEGWLVCDGQMITQEEYPALFKSIGTKWGKLSHSPFDGGDAVSFVLPEVRSPAPNLHYIIHAK